MSDWSEDWEALVEYVQPDHRLLVNGPFKNGFWSVGVIWTGVHPHRQVASATGPLAASLRSCKEQMEDMLRTVYTWSDP